jgi:DNA-binding CsgD family transcriptional regulator
MMLLDVRNPVIRPAHANQAVPSSLSIIETTYDLEADDATWLDNVLHQIRPFIEHGLGVYANFYRTSSDGSVVDVDSPIFLGCKPGFFEAVVEAATMLRGVHIRAAYGGPPCQSARQAYARVGIVYADEEGMRLLERKTGTADLLTVNAWRGNNQGCAFIGVVGRERRFSARSAGMLSRASRHIAAAQRLRHVVRRGDGAVSLDADAVLDARGSVLHAEGEAKGKRERETLTSSARKLLSVQERFRETDPEQVTSLWNALVDGRWSLVHSFDSDGKRFLLARRNAIELADPSALTPTERQIAALFARGHSSKLVAYELGHSASVVSSTLQRALRKLRLRSRAELLALFNVR